MHKLIVGTVKGGFVFSSDDRKNWRQSGQIFRGWKLTAIARSTSGRFIAGVASDVYGTTVQLSENLGTWEQVENGPAYGPATGRRLDQIWRFGVSPDVIYAGVSEAGLFASTDDGESWRPVEGLNSHPTRSEWVPGAGGLCAHSLLIDPSNPDRVWCGISAVGLFRTDDGGASWVARNEGIQKTVETLEHPDIGYCVHAVVADPDNADALFRQDHMGMYRSRNGGDSWEQIEKGLPSGFGFPLAIDRRKKVLYAFPQESPEYRMPPDGRFQVYRSLDSGDSWHPAGVAGEPSYAGVLRGALVVDSEDPCGVYAGTTSGTVHISADGGDTWQTLPDTLPRILCVQIFTDA